LYSLPAAENLRKHSNTKEDFLSVPLKVAYVFNTPFNTHNSVMAKRDRLSFTAYCSCENGTHETNYINIA